MLASVSCILARLTQTCRVPEPGAAQLAPPGGMLRVTIKGSRATCGAGGMRPADCGGKQNRAARVRHFDPLDVALLEQAPGDRCDSGDVAGGERRGEQRAGRVAHAVGPRLQFAFQSLLDRRISELIDVGGLDPVLVIGKTAEQQRQRGARRQGRVSKYLVLRLCAIDG